MDLELTAEQQMLRDSVRDFAARELMPVAAELDEKGVFPQKQVDRMFEMGLMAIAVPAEYGGAGMGAMAYALALEEVSVGCASCSVIMSVNNSLACDPILKYGSPKQKSTWLPKLADGKAIGCFALSEPGTGSDAAAQATTARRGGMGWGDPGREKFHHQWRGSRGVCAFRDG